MINAQQNIREWHGADAPTCARALCREPYALYFDSCRPEHPLNRYSIICWAPAETITAKNGTITHNDADVGPGDVFSFLQDRLRAYDFAAAKDIPALPFIGGAAGYFGYDLGRTLEVLPATAQDDINMPDMMIGIYTNALVFNHSTDKAWLIGEEPQIKETPSPAQNDTSLDWKFIKTEEEYCADIQTAIDYIYAGEIYQVNLSRRMDAPLPPGFDALDHYMMLRTINPAPFCSYMNFGDIALSSTSPERFLFVEGKNAESRPIKGTLPSDQGAALLQNSAKDRAENTMIVDLLRNDLSKICDFHSVKVPALCALETFAGVHHLVSTVTGTLRGDKDALDLLRACFPGGSITGAPKIRSMEIIEELEPTRRGAYCGAMGYIGFDGKMDTNIAIRTLIYANGRAYLQTGGGIVSDSVPAKELQESLDKAAKILESFETTAQQKRKAQRA